MSAASSLTRSLRALTALLAVWCLGCSAYDQLVAGFFSGSGGRVMVCAAEKEASVGTGASTEDGWSAIVAPTSDRDDAASCGCETCIAPVPTSLVIAPLPVLLPSQPHADSATPQSVARTPLVPPPQRTA
jgi:hypothetical protein